MHFDGALGDEQARPVAAARLAARARGAQGDVLSRLTNRCLAEALFDPRHPLTRAVPVNNGASVSPLPSSWPEPSGDLVAFVTRHGKQRLAAQGLSELGLHLVHLDGPDTDLLGTFTRERPREGTALDAARTKLAWGFEHAPHARFALASEGSFGPHPQLPWVAAGHELVLLKDRRTGLELRGEDLSEDTNFGAETVESLEEANDFARRHGFPEHALIVGPHKGVASAEQLEALVQGALALGPVWLETDMRAHLNPTRQRSILRAMGRCFQALASRCPRCHWPGVVVTGSLPGLPCETCQTPTRLPRALLRRCTVCGVTLEEPAPLAVAPAARCDQCNP